MNISEVENINDIMSLNKDELKQLLKQLREINRSRVRALQKLEEKTGYSSPASAYYEREKSIKGKSLNELRNIFKKEYRFYNSKTSTVTGAKNYAQEVAERFGKKAVKKSFWDAFDKFKADSDYLYMFGDSDQIRIFADFYDAKKSLNKIFKDMEDYLAGRYEATQIETSSDMWNELIENEDF